MSVWRPRLFYNSCMKTRHLASRTGEKGHIEMTKELSARPAPDIHIPEEAVEAALRAFGCECGSCRKAVMRVLRAALRAWPGIQTIKEEDRATVAAVYLLLPQENTDEK